jgi:hypothetical protein
MREGAVFTEPTAPEQLLRCTMFEGLSYETRQSLLAKHQLETRGAAQIFAGEGQKKELVYLLCKGSMKYGHQQVCSALLWLCNSVLLSFQRQLDLIVSVSSYFLPRYKKCLGPRGGAA